MVEMITLKQCLTSHSRCSTLVDALILLCSTILLLFSGKVESGELKPVRANILAFNVVSKDGGIVEGFADYVNSTAPRGGYTLCAPATYFDELSANLFCQHFGYPGGGNRMNPLRALNQTKGLGALRGFQCPPSAKNLSQCVSDTLLIDTACPTTDAIYLRCYGEGGLRLVDGINGTSNEGRLQMFSDGTWYSVCSVKNQGNVDTVCEMLGFPKNATSNFTRVDASMFDPQSRRNSTTDPCIKSGKDAAVICGYSKLPAASRGATAKSPVSPPTGTQTPMSSPTGTPGPATPQSPTQKSQGKKRYSFSLHAIVGAVVGSGMAVALF